MNYRRASFLVLFILIATMPYFIYIPLLFIAAVYFDFYIEAIPLAFMIDTLYTSSDPGFFFSFPFALFFATLVLVVLPLKDRLRFNA